MRLYRFEINYYCPRIVVLEAANYDMTNSVRQFQTDFLIADFSSIHTLRLTQTYVYFVFIFVYIPKYLSSYFTVLFSLNVTNV